MIVDMMRTFEVDHNKAPTRIYLPMSVEALYDCHLRETLSPKPEPGPILRKQRNHLMGMEVVFDANHLKLENPTQ